MVKFILIGAYLVNPNSISALQDHKEPFQENLHCIVYVAGTETGSRMNTALTIRIDGTCADFIKQLEKEQKQ